MRRVRLATAGRRALRKGRLSPVHRMTETITTADAEHHFSRLMREVADGKDFVLTVDGAPVARLTPEVVPKTPRKLASEQEEALARSMDRLRNADWGPIEHVSRDKLYEEVEEERIWSRRMP